MIFHPSDTVKTGIRRSEIENFALWFTHFLDFQKKKKSKEYEVKLLKEDRPRLSSAARELLQELQKRQQSRLAALQQQHPVRTIHGTIDWRMVIGLGGEHVLETSMTLHHIYGIPYIPGSAMKGMVRHYFLSEVLANDYPDEDLDILDAVLSNIDQTTLKEKRDVKILQKRCKVNEKFPAESTIKSVIETVDSRDLENSFVAGQRIFGTQHQRGEVIFLDAFPEGDVHFQKDIMNPHYPEYYKEKSPAPPNDCQNPIPITFLTVEQATFTFSLMLKRRNNADQDENAAAEQKQDDSLLIKTAAWLQDALQYQGIGAKSAVGYGYFEDVVDRTDSLLQKVDQARQEAEQAAARARLESLSPVERLCEELKTLSDKDRSIQIYNDELPKFEGEEQRQLAEALKTYWQSIGQWSGKMSNKQKVKVQDVQQILGE